MQRYIYVCHAPIAKSFCTVNKAKLVGILYLYFFVFVFLSEVIIYVCMIFSGGADGGWSCGATHGPTNHWQEVLRPLCRLVTILINIVITIFITIAITIVINIKIFFYIAQTSAKKLKCMNVHNSELFVLLKSNKLWAQVYLGYAHFHFMAGWLMSG